MLGFRLSEEQESFRVAVRSFAEKELAPLVEELEAAERFPKDLFRQLGTLGYLGVGYPEEYGGSGGDMVMRCLLIEELARVNCGVAAALLQVFVSPASGIPMVGASGAISGVMGGYLVLYPRVRVFALLILGFFVTSIALPAWTMLLYWAAIQFVSGLFGLLASEQGGVAFWAHTGGFVAGLVLIKLFARPGDVMAHRSERWEPRRLVGR